MNWLLKKASARGLVEGSRPWMAVGAAVLVAKGVKRVLRPSPILVEKIVLVPGERITITALDPPSMSRRAKRAETIK